MQLTYNVDNSTSTLITDSCVIYAAVEPVPLSESKSQPGPWAPIWIPTFCSIIVFVLGWVLTRLFKNKDEKKKRKDYRKMVIDWVKLAQPIEMEFINSINSFSETVAASENMQPEPYSMPQPLPNRLNELSIEKLTDSFLTDAKGDKQKRNYHLFNIISGFEFMKKISDLVHFSYDNYNKQAGDLCQQWSDTYMEFINNINVSSYIQEYKPILDKWQKALSKHHNSFKVNELYVDMLFDKANIINDTDLMPYINRMDYITKQSQELNKGVAKLFQSISIMTQPSLDSMIAASEYLKD